MGLRDRLRAVIGRGPARADVPAPSVRAPTSRAPTSQPAGRVSPAAPGASPRPLPPFPAPRPFSPDEALPLHPVSLADGRPSPASLPLDRPLLVVGADELDAAAFAEVLAAHGAPVVRYSAAAGPASAPPRSSA